MHVQGCLYSSYSYNYIYTVALNEIMVCSSVYLVMLDYTATMGYILEETVNMLCPAAGVSLAHTLITSHEKEFHSSN